MTKIGNFAALAAMTLSLSACDFLNNALFPSTRASGQPVGAQSASPATPAPAPITVPAQPLDQALPGATTPTLTGQKVQELRGDFARLQTAINEQSARHLQLRDDVQRNSASYQATVAGINSRLQVGTTPGNPAVVQAWKNAQNQLQSLDKDLDQLSLLSNDVASNSAYANFLLQSIRASYTVSGAVEEDHRQLRLLEDQTEQSAVNINRLLANVTDDVQRQTRFLEVERGNLASLSLGISEGQIYNTGPLGSRVSAIAGPGGYAAPPGVAPVIGAPVTNGLPGTISSGRPLMVIRFDHDNVNYQQPLYQAANEALQRKPDVSFDVVGVAPGVGSPAQVAQNSNAVRADAMKVMNSLIAMGMPQSRLTLSSVTDPAVQTNEVHLYVH
ncbi:MAG TPA: hypothetical protein VHL08_01860 [Dongiaceae bacterium]|jgi:hypothetical protein|nr:hypothetical protein [Dongiaceae bacterium]